MNLSLHFSLFQCETMIVVLILSYHYSWKKETKSIKTPTKNNYLKLSQLAEDHYLMVSELLSLILDFGILL